MGYILIYDYVIIMHTALITLYEGCIIVLLISELYRFNLISWHGLQ